MREIEQRTYTATFVTAVYCDICGGRIKESRWGVDEVEVRHKTGTAYPEGGSGQEYRPDICGSCCDEVIRSAIEAAAPDLVDNPPLKDWDF